MCYKAENPQNVTLNGSEVTLFDVYRYCGNDYVFQGKYTADGFNASQHKCLRSFLDATDVLGAFDNETYNGE